MGGLGNALSRAAVAAGFGVQPRAQTEGPLGLTGEHWRERGRPPHEWPFPWTIKKDFPRYLMALNEDDIRTELLRLRQLMIEASRQLAYHFSVTFGGLTDATGGDAPPS